MSVAALLCKPLFSPNEPVSEVKSESIKLNCDWSRLALIPSSPFYTVSVPGARLLTNMLLVTLILSGVDSQLVARRYSKQISSVSNFRRSKSPPTCFRRSETTAKYTLKSGRK